MQLNSINYFVTIAQEKSISKAADKLFVSQPALSPVSYTHLTLPTKA